MAQVISKQLLNSIACQRGTEFEVVISDNSRDNAVQEVWLL